MRIMGWVDAELNEKRPAVLDRERMSRETTVFNDYVDQSVQSQPAPPTVGVYSSSHFQLTTFGSSRGIGRGTPVGYPTTTG